MARGDVAMAGEAADGAVDDVDLGGIEEVGDGSAPAPEAVGAFSVSVADGGVADEDDGGQVGIGRSGEAEIGLLLAGAELRAARSLRCGRSRGWRDRGSWRGRRGGRRRLSGESEQRQEAGEHGGEKCGVRGCGFQRRDSLVMKRVAILQIADCCPGCVDPAITRDDSGGWKDEE